MDIVIDLEMCIVWRLQEVDVLTPFWSKLQSLWSTKEPKATAVLLSRTLRVWKCTCSLRVCYTVGGGRSWGLHSTGQKWLPLSSLWQKWERFLGGGGGGAFCQRSRLRLGENKSNAAKSTLMQKILLHVSLFRDHIKKKKHTHCFFVIS